MDDNPSVKAEATDEDVNLMFCNMSSRAFLGIVNAGAMANVSADDINFGDKLDEIGYPYTVFFAPSRLYLLRRKKRLQLESERTNYWRIFI